MSARETTSLTADEWMDHVRAAAKAATGLIGDIQARADGPGEAVLALIIAARAVCFAHQDSLPPFEWFADRVFDLHVQVEYPPGPGRPQA